MGAPHVLSGPLKRCFVAAGGDVIRFVVNNIGLAFPPVFAGSYTNGNTTYNSSSCVRSDPFTLQCTTRAVRVHMLLGPPPAPHLVCVYPHG